MAALPRSPDFLSRTLAQSHTYNTHPRAREIARETERNEILRALSHLYIHNIGIHARVCSIHTIFAGTSTLSCVRVRPSCHIGVHRLGGATKTDSVPKHTHTDIVSIHVCTHTRSCVRKRQQQQQPAPAHSSTSSL